MLKVVKTSKFDREEKDHYVEPEWVTEVLFRNEVFRGSVWDPCCGFGTIPKIAKSFGHRIIATDLEDRGYDALKETHDFFEYDLGNTPHAENIVCNPPYGQLEEFIDHALTLVPGKIAVFTRASFLFSTKRREKYMNDWPLVRVYLLAPRPSCLPGEMIKAGVKPTGGVHEYVWLVMNNEEYKGVTELCWLYKEECQEDEESE